MHIPFVHSSHIFSNILSTFNPETASNMDFDFSFLDTFSPVGNTEFSLAGTSQDFSEIATFEGMFELASNQLAAPTDVQQHNSASSSISSHTQIEFDPFETEHFSSWNAVSPSMLSFNHTTDVYPALSSLQCKLTASGNRHLM
ncbi:hypothetical protein HBI22_142430 [Parastagonospora nodorum]|nr:hypothetical protein HBI22_142430 [Parastagonospora nodorum]